jgi:hypothetical protein
MILKDTILEFNDCTAIQLMDCTGTLFAIKDSNNEWGVTNDGWFVDGTSPAGYITDNPTVEIFKSIDVGSRSDVSRKYWLCLQVSLDTPDKKNVIFDYIDLYNLSIINGDVEKGGYYSTPSNLVWCINGNNLKIKNTPSQGLIQDGIYTITYSIFRVNSGPDDTTPISTVINKVFISGIVRNKVYKALSNLFIETNNLDLKENNYNEVLYSYTLLRSLENSNFLAQNIDLLSGLKTLEKFLNTTKCFKHKQ